MSKHQTPQQHTAYDKLLRGGKLNRRDVEGILDWQLQLPAEQIDCVLIAECTLFLDPERDRTSAPRKAAIWSQIRDAIQAEPAQENQAKLRHTRLSARRIAVLILAALLLLALATIAVATLLHIDVFNIYTGRVYSQDLPRQEQADTLVERPLLTLSFAHVDVTVRQAAYDGHELRILYSMRDRDATEPISNRSVESYEWVTPAAQQDRLTTVGDWIEIDGQMDFPYDQLALPGEAPGEMLYFVSLEPKDKTLKDRVSFEVGLPLMWDADNRFKIVPDGMRFTVHTAQLGEVTRNAEPVRAIIDGAEFSLDDGSFSPISAALTLIISGKTTEELDAISQAWGNAQVYTPEGAPIGVTAVRSWSFQVPGQVTITYRVIPPQAWPDEMILAVLGADGEPDMIQALPIRLSLRE